MGHLRQLSKKKNRKVKFVDMIMHYPPFYSCLIFLKFLVGNIYQKPDILERKSLKDGCQSQKCAIIFIFQNSLELTWDK